eukprot:CAMPEP_0202470374 /NCGR_PEP_ID=MMETSP1360-20130828/81424_1 /ASSEMBLY_ACC=CAM_ASM_000848 /TAXON_ID=515479 /ORGANISM="Licmophora paradoxa, Strain CCMP2313" /LENGTH=67 /DNA_ID=CAMNT_0049096061 /DNA_START=212 /DNA_END=412 /DNA_ORIENTATION=+
MGGDDEEEEGDGEDDEEEEYVVWIVVVVVPSLSGEKLGKAELVVVVEVVALWLALPTTNSTACWLAR